ncbi:hypothetical protein DEE25_10270, partial [Neisseria gonorrhoeae]
SDEKGKLPVFRPCELLNFAKYDFCHAAADKFHFLTDWNLLLRLICYLNLHIKRQVLSAE